MSEMIWPCSRRPLLLQPLLRHLQARGLVQHLQETKVEVLNKATTSRPMRVRVSAATGKKWKSVVGLEVHAQISSNTKLFSGSAAKSKAPANTAVSYFDSALPGTLPVLNKRCVEAGIQTALALNCRLNLCSTFDRKHYFYADLPAGYQITQQRNPLGLGGRLDFPVLKPNSSTVAYHHSAGIVQLQLEQDSGKSLHDEATQQSLIDLNRCGVGLMEIVFQPDLFDGEEASALVKELVLILRRLGSCSCNMQDGALRVDANISVQPHVDDSDSPTPLGTRTEVKNVNSVKHLAKAIEFEVERQIFILEKGGVVENETRSFDAEANVTMPMRDKEVKQDYRFMPEPNLPPLRLWDSDNPPEDGCRRPNNPNILDVSVFRHSMPELPSQTRNRLMHELKLTSENTQHIVASSKMFSLLEMCLSQRPKSPNIVANLIINDVPRWRKTDDDRDDTTSDESIFDSVRPELLVEIADLKHSRDVPHNLLMKAMEVILTEPEKYQTVEALMEDKGWKQSMRDPERIAREVNRVIDDNPVLTELYCSSGSKVKKRKRAYSKLLDLLARDLEHEMDMRLVAKSLEEELNKRPRNK